MRFNDSEDNTSTLNDINVTPLVDIMLVLLVIFIVTAPLLTNTIPVNLPKTETVDSVAAPVTPLVINVDQQGKVTLDNNTVALEQLQQQLSAAAANRKDPQVQLQADQGVNYGRVAQVMAIIERAGITRLSVMTER